MEWMINTQLGRRNLPPAQRLAVVEKFKKKIQEEAKEKQEESNKQFYGNQYKTVSSPNGEQSKNKLHTDKELAKLAGVMQWMISHQQARRNLSPGELIFANSMVAEEIAEENKKKQIEGGRIGADITNGKTSSVQMDGSRSTTEDSKSHTSPTHTREQVAKLSGVGTGTVARYEYKNNLSEINPGGY